MNLALIATIAVFAVCIFLAIFNSPAAEFKKHNFTPASAQERKALHAYASACLSLIKPNADIEFIDIHTALSSPNNDLLLAHFSARGYAQIGKDHPHGELFRGLIIAKDGARFFKDLSIANTPNAICARTSLKALSKSKAFLDYLAYSSSSKL